MQKKLEKESKPNKPTKPGPRTPTAHTSLPSPSPLASGPPPPLRLNPAGPARPPPLLSPRPKSPLGPIGPRSARSRLRRPPPFAPDPTSQRRGPHPARPSASPVLALPAADQWAPLVIPIPAFLAAQRPRRNPAIHAGIPPGTRLPKITGPRYKRCPHPGNLPSPLQRRPNPSCHALCAGENPLRHR